MLPCAVPPDANCMIVPSALLLKVWLPDVLADTAPPVPIPKPTVLLPAPGASVEFWLKRRLWLPTAEKTCVEALASHRYLTDPCEVNSTSSAWVAWECPYSLNPPPSPTVPPRISRLPSSIGRSMRVL